LKYILQSLIVPVLADMKSLIKKMLETAIQGHSVSSVAVPIDSVWLPISTR